jgi:hypothetical protein
MSFVAKLLRMNDGADYLGKMGKSLTEGNNPLLTGANADDAAKFFRGESDTISGVSKDTISNLTSVRGHMQQELKGGGTKFTEQGVRAMYKNVSEGGNVNAGLSVAGMTKSNIPGFQAMGNPSKELGSMAMGGMLGAGAANLVGGDPMDGATLGVMAGMAGSIGARAFRESIGDIETSVMKKVLKKDFADKAVPGSVGTYNGRRVERVGDEFVMPRKTGSGEVRFDATSHKGQAIARDAKFKNVSARSQNLNALKDPGRDTSDLGRVDKFIYDRMMDAKKPSLGMQSRAATASGAMLAGAMFSSARTKDKRRGFNRNRGNRF